MTLSVETLKPEQTDPAAVSLRPNDQRAALPSFIAVEGPIGVGKTTLARRLADTLGYPLMLEPAAENPFLDRFYTEGASQALPTQLFFYYTELDSWQISHQGDCWIKIWSLTS